MKFGVMQGRLSKRSKNKIQSFPWENWDKEFEILSLNKLFYLEWTIDFYNFYKNPIFTNYRKILYLKKKYKIKIDSITCDCFMEKPFWKKKNEKFELYFQDLITASRRIGIKYLVLPLVDNSSIKNVIEERNLISILKNNLDFIKKNKIQIIFESDFNPSKLLTFIKNFDIRYFGINYDVGNSASLGFDMVEEFKKYGKYIKNIHIKDRVKSGTTVRLGEGNANFEIFFEQIKKINYNRTLIFQTARSKKINEDLKEILINKSFIKNFI